MQGCGFHIARSNKLPLALLALICASLFLWPWEKAPLMSSLLPSLEQFSILIPGIFSLVLFVLLIPNVLMIVSHPVHHKTWVSFQ